MAAEVRSESWSWVASPRISFSHDLSQPDLSPADNVDGPRLDNALPLQYSDFDFSNSFEISVAEPSSADELFSNGKLLPMPIKNSTGTARRPSTSDTHAPLAPALDRRKRGSLKEMMASSEEESKEEKEEQEDVEDDSHRGITKRTVMQQRSFWRFGRSSSIGDERPKAGMICQFLLSRSKSTGSDLNPNPNPKRRQLTKTNNNNGNNTSASSRKAPGDSSAKTYYFSGSGRGAYGNGVRINPVLNVPALYFSRGNSSGNNSNPSSVFGYLLCSCNNKSTRRTAVTCSPKRIV